MSAAVHEKRSPGVEVGAGDGENPRDTFGAEPRLISTAHGRLRPGRSSTKSTSAPFEVR